MIKYKFKILISAKNAHSIRCDIHPISYSQLQNILWTFPTVSELEWFSEAVIKAAKANKREYTGLNSFVCMVMGEDCELSLEYDVHNVFKIPTKVVLDFINQAILFHELYNKGGIPSIIPESKQDEWVIVPKEYVKEDFWKSKSE